MNASTENVLHPWFTVTLDGVLQTRVLEASEESGFVVRQRVVSGQIVCENEKAQLETVHGVVVVGLSPNAPDWAREEFARLRAGKCDHEYEAASFSIMESVRYWTCKHCKDTKQQSLVRR